jgi:class 3 adenylate cyclase
MKSKDPGPLISSRNFWSSLNIWVRTLQFTFTFQVTFALVISFALGNYILYRAASKRLFDQQERVFRDHTLYLSRGVLTWQKSIEDTMRLVASSSGIRSLDPKQLQDNLLPLFEQTPLRRWKVWRADGKLLASSIPVTNILLEELRNRKNTNFKRTLAGSFNYGVNSVLSGPRLEGCLESSYPIFPASKYTSPLQTPSGVLTFCLPFSKIGQDSGLSLVNDIQDNPTIADQSSEQLIELNRGIYKGRIFFLISPTGNLVFPTVNNTRFDHISLLSPTRIAATRWYPFIKASRGPAGPQRVQQIQLDGNSFFMYTHQISDQWTAVSIVDEGSVYAPLHRNLSQLMLVQAVTLLITSIAIYFVCRQLTKPLKAIVRTVSDLSDLKIPVEPACLSSSSIVEVTQVSNAIHRLSFAMDSFGRYLPKEVVRSVLGSNQSARLGGDVRKLVILFTDIKDFTSYSEVLEASELLSCLNKYLTALTDAILKTSGTIDKYIGDSIMAFWGAPTAVASPASLACEAAIAIQQETDRINQQWESEGVAIRFETRVGVNIGDIIVGNVGSEERFNYTVIGDPVNLASRLESANKLYGSGIMVSTAIVDTVAAEGNAGVYVFRLLDRIKVKGKQEVSEIHELLGKATQFEDQYLRDLDSANEIMAQALHSGEAVGLQLLSSMPKETQEHQPLMALRQMLELRLQRTA